MSKNKLLPFAVVIPIGLSLLSSPAAHAAEPVPESFTYNGAGWGHGVGMSQYGAYGMALEGNSAEKILEHYYNPAQLTNSTSYASSDILVQVLGGQSSTTITPSNGQLRVKFDGKTIASSKPVNFAVSSGKVKITVDGKSYTTSGTSGVTLEWQNTRYWNSGSANTTVAVPKANGGYSNGNYRHGKITVKLLKNSLNIVNSLRLNDEYLYGLAEVPSSWPSAALQSQAIAGRTYAQKNMSSVKVGCGCNVYDEVASQKFTGWNKENEANGYIGKKWVTAVNATQSKTSAGTPTSAKVMKYNNALIDAVYSSTTGGKTRSAKNVWGYDHAYLQSRDDRWALNPATGNPNRAWSNTITQSKAKSAYGLSDVKKITIKRDSDQTLISSTAISSTGKTSTLTSAQTRSVFGAKSRWVFGITAKGETLPATDDYVVTNTPANVKYKTTANLNMRSGPSTAYGSLKVVALNSEVVTTGKKSGTWLQVKSGTTTGWVSASYLSKVAAAPAPKPTPKPTPKPVPKPVAPKPVVKTSTYVSTANVHLRTKASSASLSKGILAKGKATEVYSISGGWAKVKNGSGVAYVSSSYLTKKTTSTSKPSAPAPKPTVQKTTKYKASTAVNIRMKASASSTKKGLLAKGKTVEVYSVSGGWAKVKNGSGVAYVSSSYLVKVSSSKSAPAKSTPTVVKKKTTAGLNLRTGAGTGHKVIQTIPKNASVQLTGKKSGTWVQVKYGSKTGWVSSTYIK